MGVWVCGGKIKNKDQLNLAEAEVEAELGKRDFNVRGLGLVIKSNLVFEPFRQKVLAKS